MKTNRTTLLFKRNKKYVLGNIVLLIVPFLFLTIGCEEEQKEEDSIISFVKTYGGLDNEFGYSVCQSTDSGYIITGTKHITGTIWSNILLIKTDLNGNEEWTKIFDFSNFEHAHSVQQTYDDGYIIVGSIHNPSNAILIKTDADGNGEWVKTFGGSENDNALSVQQTTDSGYIITGSTKSFGNGVADVWLIKTDANGDSLWTKTFGGSENDNALSVQQTTDSGYIITGSTKSFGNGVADVWLIKTDANGDSLWTKTFGGSDNDNAFSVQQTTDSGYIITGNTKSFGDGTNYIWLIKTDSNGNEIWNQTISSINYETGYSAQLTEDGGLIILGETVSLQWDIDVLLIKTDIKGIEEWRQTFNRTRNDQVRSVQQTTDGGYIITGRTISFEDNNSDLLLIKTDNEGDVVIQAD